MRQAQNIMEDRRVSCIDGNNMNFLSKRKDDKVRSFDCAICRESLKAAGPPLEYFSFGQVLNGAHQLPARDREIFYREFLFFDQCFTNGHYDCNKILSTVCGHLFHSGCIREWFFMRRLDMVKRCPFCNQRTSYDDCRIIHPTACCFDEVDDEPEVQQRHDKQLQTDIPPDTVPSEYSDISCASSSFSSDDSDVIESETEEPSNVQSERSNELDESITLHGENVDNEDENEYNAEFIGKAEGGGGVIMKTIRFIDEFNLMYIFVLKFASNILCAHYQQRREEFSEMLEYVEDDELAEVEENEFVPLEYDFILHLFLLGLIIFFLELMLADFRRR